MAGSFGQCLPLAGKPITLDLRFQIAMKHERFEQLQVWQAGLTLAERMF